MTRHWTATDLHQLARDREQTEQELARAESGPELCNIKNRLEMIDRQIKRTKDAEQ